MATSTTVLIIIAASVLYFALGRGALYLYGKTTNGPMSYRAMRATARGSLTGGEADVLTGIIWLVMLLVWPFLIGFAIYVSLRKRITGKAVTVSIKGVTVSNDPEEPGEPNDS